MDSASKSHLGISAAPVPLLIKGSAFERLADKRWDVAGWCVCKWFERLRDESMEFIWVTELYLTFKQEESSVRAQSVWAVGA